MKQVLKNTFFLTSTNDSKKSSLIYFFQVQDYSQYHHIEEKLDGGTTET